MTAWNNFFSDYLSKLYIPRIGWTDVIEIIIIAVVLYNILVWIKKYKSMGAAQGNYHCSIICAVCIYTEFKDNSLVAGKTISVGIIALVIIFQPELRRALEQLGRKKLVVGLFNFGEGREKGERFSSKTADEIVRAAYEMGAVRTWCINRYRAGYGSRGICPHRYRGRRCCNKPAAH